MTVVPVERDQVDEASISDEMCRAISDYEASCNPFLDDVINLIVCRDP